MFIPPQGAMQFLIERNVIGMPTPAKFAPLVAWVQGPQPFNKHPESTCPHELGYAIIEESLPVEIRTCTGTNNVVCDCCGHLIE